MKRDVDVSKRTMALRAAARVALGLSAQSVACGTCARSVNMPYRRYAPDGSIIEGCIDASHTEAMLVDKTSASHAWHFRKIAAKHRAEVLKEIESK